MKRVIKVISIFIPTILSIFIINFFFQIVPMEKIQGLPVLISFYVAPIGLVMATSTYILDRDKLSLVGIIFNAVLFLFPTVYHFAGTLIFGV